MVLLLLLDSMKIKVTPSKSMESDLNVFSPSTPVTRKYVNHLRLFLDNKYRPVINRINKFINSTPKHIIFYFINIYNFIV